MLIKITVQGGMAQKVETSEPALVQICDLDAEDYNEPPIATFETGGQQDLKPFASDEEVCRCSINRSENASSSTSKTAA